MADMQYKVQNSEKDGDTNELSDLLKIGQKGNAEEEIKKIQRELQMQHESEMQSMQQTLKKIQKELSYKEEDIRKYK